MNRETVEAEYEEVMEDLHDTLSIITAFDLVIEEYESTPMVLEAQQEEMLTFLKMRKDYFYTKLLVIIDPQIMKYRAMLRHPSLRGEA